MPAKCTQHADLKKLDKLVSGVAFGENDPHIVHKQLRKEINRAKSSLNVDRLILFRMMMGTVELFAKHKVRAKKQYLAVLRMRPESTEAMMSLSFVSDHQEAMRWLELAFEISERKGDFSRQLISLDNMVFTTAYKKHDYNAIAVMIKRMQNVLDVASGNKELPAHYLIHTTGIEWLLYEGRGRDVVDYLEQLYKAVIQEGCGPQRMVMCPLVAAYSQCGLSIAEARSKVLQYRELCSTDRSRDGFDRAFQKAFDVNQYHALEMYGLKREWFQE